MSKLIIGVAVVGNLLSDQYSFKAFWIGLITAMITMIIGFIIDRMEVSKNDKY
ncbi:MAG: hypothetical protein PH343_06960 [Nitrospira sp.]|nr:hypothetical protein [Nitrospira sp.]